MTTTNKTISQALARQNFDYNAKTGDLIWKRRLIPEGATKLQARAIKAFNTKYAGKVAGCINGDGYRVTAFNGKPYLAHRVVWAWHYGSPEADLDHKDGDRLNNRIKNLRPCDHAGNAFNKKTPCHNQSGVKGIHTRVTASGKVVYIAQIMTNGKYKYLGTWPTLETAAAVRWGAAKALHGQFARAA